MHAAILHADLRRDADIDQLVTFTVGRFGGIDFLLNAAATYADQGIDSDRAAWRNGFDTNLFGHVMLVRRSLEALRRSSWPSVVYFSSESAHVGLTGRWIYPATKAAIEQVTRSQALDLAPDRIRVNAVMPGWTEKPWLKSAPQEVKDRYAILSDRLHMIGRQGTLEEVVRCGSVPVLGACRLHHRKLSAGRRRTQRARTAGQGEAFSDRCPKGGGCHVSGRGDVMLGAAPKTSHCHSNRTINMIPRIGISACRFAIWISWPRAWAQEYPNRRITHDRTVPRRERTRRLCAHHRRRSWRHDSGSR